MTPGKGKPEEQKITFDRLKDTDLFQITMNALNDKRLVDNIMYQKMVARLQAFYV